MLSRTSKSSTFHLVSVFKSNALPAAQHTLSKLRSGWLMVEWFLLVRVISLQVMFSRSRNMYEEILTIPCKKWCVAQTYHINKLSDLLFGKHFEKITAKDANQTPMSFDVSWDNRNPQIIDETVANDLADFRLQTRCAKPEILLETDNNHKPILSP